MSRKRLMPDPRLAPVASGADADLWFLAYDIADPKRLRRVHRCVRREGVAVQLSGFAVAADHHAMRSLLDRLGSIIDAKVDDVRAYRLPARCQMWTLGRQAWPDGLVLAGHDALLRLLSSDRHAPEAASEEAADDAAVTLAVSSIDEGPMPARPPQ